MRVQIIGQGGQILDEQSETFGMRKIEIRDRHLLINGERVRLTGVTRHEESVVGRLGRNSGHHASRL